MDEAQNNKKPTPKQAIHFLHHVSETLLITLYARAKESVRPDAMLHDPQAVALVDSLDYDFSPFNKKLTTTGVVVRARHFDDTSAEFLTLYPDACIISLGSGLDTRQARLSERGYRPSWFIDVDFPDVIAARSELLALDSDNTHAFSTSVLGEQWMQEAKELIAGRPVLIIAEGLMMYLPHSEIKQLIASLKGYFPKATFIFDVTTPWYRRFKQETVKHTKASFASGVSSARGFARQHDLILLKDCNVFDLAPERMGWAGQLAKWIPPLRQVLRFLHYKL